MRPRIPLLITASSATLAACDLLGPDTSVASIAVVRAETLLYHGQSAAIADIGRRLFEARTADGNVLDDGVILAQGVSALVGSGAVLLTPAAP